MGAAFGGPRQPRKTLVPIFQRGGSDGLNIVIPHGEKRYYELRPNIAIRRKDVLDLDGFFGLHPSLKPLKRFYDSGQLAIVHAAGSRAQMRSHIDAQDYVEAGLRTADHETSCAPFAGGAGDYPDTRFGNRLCQIARLIKEDSGVEMASADIGGWDHHAGESRVLPYVAAEFAKGLAAFWNDLGERAADVTIVTMSEFGRAIRENTAGGTEHGWGGVMFVMGGAIPGGKVYGRWPGLEGDVLRVTTDFRDVFDWCVPSPFSARPSRGRRQAARSDRPPSAHEVLETAADSNVAISL